jgi:hypothetical protein
MGISFFSSIVFLVLLVSSIWLRFKLKDESFLKTRTGVAIQGVVFLVLCVAMGARVLPLNIGAVLVGASMLWLLISIAISLDENED